MTIFKTSLLVVILMFFSNVYAEPQTLSLKEGETSPKANIEQIAWLTGAWRGEALGGIAEDIWSPPSAGAMVGSFRVISGGKIKFYEIEIIREHQNSLVLQLKHFNSDLTGWEEKNQTVDFPLVKITENAAFFDGFSIIRINENQIKMVVRVGDKQKEKAPQELEFNYTRFSLN